MAIYRVDEVKLSGGQQCEHIIMLKGISVSDGSNWTKPTPTVIQAIKLGDAFYTKHTEQAKLYVNNRNGKEFVETTSDRTKKDNLLKLPRF